MFGETFWCAAVDEGRNYKEGQSTRERQQVHCYKKKVNKRKLLLKILQKSRLTRGKNGAEMSERAPLLGNAADGDRDSPVPDSTTRYQSINDRFVKLSYIVSFLINCFFGFQVVDKS